MNASLLAASKGHMLVLPDHLFKFVHQDYNACEDDNNRPERERKIPQSNIITKPDYSPAQNK
jgi:hypothetical protein